MNEHTTTPPGDQNQPKKPRRSRAPLPKNRLADLVRDRRLGANLTQEELATRVHTRRETIASIERGSIRIPSPNLLRNISRELGNVTLVELLVAIYGTLDEDIETVNQALAAQVRLLDTIRRLIDRRRPHGEQGTGDA